MAPWGRQSDSALRCAAAAPVEAQGSIGFAQLASLSCAFNQGLQRVSLRWWVHAQQGRTLAPSLQVLLQKLRPTVADQHGFKEAIGQEQGAVVEGEAEGLLLFPTAPRSRRLRWSCQWWSCQRLQQGLQFPHQLLCFAKGIRVGDDSAAGMGPQGVALAQ